MESGPFSHTVMTGAQPMALSRVAICLAVGTILAPVNSASAGAPNSPIAHYLGCVSTAAGTAFHASADIGRAVNAGCERLLPAAIQYCASTRGFMPETCALIFGELDAESTLAAELVKASPPLPPPYSDAAPNLPYDDCVNEALARGDAFDGVNECRDELNQVVGQCSVDLGVPEGACDAVFVRNYLASIP